MKRKNYKQPWIPADEVGFEELDLDDGLGFEEDDEREVVYLIADQDGFLKIGKVTASRTNVGVVMKARLSKLQTGSRSRLHVLSVFGGHRKTGPSLERALHAHFIDKQVSGEWFGDIEYGDVLEAVDAVKNLWRQTGVNLI
jgi:hypothetical protein